MSKKSGYLLGMLLTIIICMILAWIFCCGAGASAASTTDKQETTIDDQNAVAAATAATSMGFNLRGTDGNFAFTSNDNFNFNSSDFAIITPVAGDVNGGIAKLKGYFDAENNDNKMVNITGYYDSDEVNNSAYANLGLARATAVKNYFVDQGISSSRINTYGELREELVPDGDIYRGPVSYNLYAQAAEDEAKAQEELANMAEAIKADPLVIYFDYSEASVNLNAQQRKKLGDITRYLDKVEGSSITVEGHTDSQGSMATNDRLGLERAEFGKQYLQNNGIAGAKIKTVTKGERNPIATNDTEEGRAQNRRAVITIN
ncbi:MAG: OmpA family protein [Dokdonia donghaensis]|jgi:OOP family OmpA-OmpF porin|nr:OmpA family protein [Dokdonia donghaensis]